MIQSMSGRLRTALGLLTAVLGGASLGAQAKEVWVMDLDGAISPATADYYIHTLHGAEQANAAALVVRLDTPGGLDSAMRDMIKETLAASVPVVVYVAPSGSRAASAGTYLLYASHVAAMAPATNVGSSTPVQIGGGGPLPTPAEPDGGEGGDSDGAGEKGNSGAMERKVVNDAVAYIRGLAALRGRNAEWAEETVREAANLPAQEALEQGVIDLIAPDLDALLAALQGRSVMLEGRAVTLDLRDAEVKTVEPGWRYELLALITDPNVAYILLMLGIYGLLLEFYHPGTGVPGVTGVICLLLAAYGLQMLPINYAGVALLLVGIGLMVAEVITPTLGVLGVGGVIAFVAGSIILLDSDLPGYRVSMPIIAAFAVASLGIVVFVGGLALRARRQRVSTGRESMIGAGAVALEDFDGQGLVRAYSEIWQARSRAHVHKGDRMRVTAVDGLVLTVEREDSA
jgi:membrane-bound serine protease (ClpP class)